MPWAKVVTKPANKRKPWVVRYAASGKHHERSFALKREADAFKIKVDYETRARIFVEPDERTTLEGYFDAWLATHAVSDGTKRTYRSVFGNRIKPVLGSKPVGKVTRDDIRALLLEDMPREVGPDAIKTARTLLVAMFGEALRSG